MMHNKPLPSRRPALRQLNLLAAGLLLALSAQAGSLPAPARTEIDSLLNKLQSSGCQFNRNGAWYSGAEARTHLLRKLDYLDGKDAIRSAEQFIQLGASASSSSGKPYLVRCGSGDKPLESAAWLNAELKALRAGGQTQ